MLVDIAARELGSAGRWQEIVRLNPGLQPTRMLPNTKLQMPPRRKPGETKPTAKAAEAGKGGAVANAIPATYTVQRGDTSVALTLSSTEPRWLVMRHHPPSCRPQAFTSSGWISRSSSGTSQCMPARPVIVRVW